MRRSAELQIITEALQKMGPHAPATRIWGRAPGANSDMAAEGNVWAGEPHDVALHIVTRLYGRQKGEPLSPLAQAEDAKRARDLIGEVGILMSAGADLESAPWYPARPGDLVHVHYEAGGSSDAFGETYIIAASEHGFLSMQLLAHTLPEAEDNAGMVGCFAVEDDPDPLMELWFEAGPHRLTIVRDGRPVHIGGAR
jgi:hypothetical protein